MIFGKAELVGEVGRASGMLALCALAEVPVQQSGDAVLNEGSVAYGKQKSLAVTLAEEKAIEAVKRWRFRPALGADGHPVATLAPIEVPFRLR